MQWNGLGKEIGRDREVDAILLCSQLHIVSVSRNRISTDEIGLRMGAQSARNDRLLEFSAVNRCREHAAWKQRERSYRVN
jgi:hypothetical protein